MPSSGNLGAGFAAARLDNHVRDALRRLSFALLLSAGVHIVLLCGLRVRPGETQAPPVMTVLSAQLVADDRDLPVSAGDPPAPTVQLGIGGASPGPSLERRPPNRLDRSASKRSAPTPPVQRVARVAPAIGVRQDAVPPEVSMSIPRDPTWYPAKQLDAIPRALVPIQPKYRETSGSATKGRVVVLLSIDESGAVTEASVVEAEPEGYFEESSLAAAREARFQPGAKDGRIVKSRVLVELRYGL